MILIKTGKTFITNNLKIFVQCLLCCISVFTAIAQDSDSLAIQLQEITIPGDRAAARYKLQSLSAVNKDKQYLVEHRSGSLMMTLDRLPGVSAFQVRQGFAKPVIRGLGFNRLVISENGIKQQGQQWGADHGLEIDQYDIDNVEIIKGPASLQYGSDAIAGVINITSNKWRAEDGTFGSVQFNGASNNNLFGASANILRQRDNRYLALRATYRNFEDYRIPATSFYYMNSVFPVYNGILKNTAGREYDVSMHAGLRNDRYEMNVSVNNIHSKSGFFAGANGIPGIADMSDDGNHRDIGMPFHSVNHFKTIVNQSYKPDVHNRLTLDAGYQYNLRREFSAPHTHAYIPGIDVDSLLRAMGNVELELRLHTLSGNAGWEYRNGGLLVQTGVNTEYQHNRVGGYFFFLPEFEQFTGGAFVTGRYMIADKLVSTAGLRYDIGSIHIHSFKGSVQSYFTIPEMNRKEGNASFMAGLSYSPAGEWNFKLNAGRSFRLPTVNEYAVHGISHDMFRVEIGDSTLRPEISYQVDAHAAFSKVWAGALVRRVSVALSGFANMFPNYIYLKPSGQFSESPEAGQEYNYVQSRAFRTGGEMEVRIDLLDRFRWETDVEYVQATDEDSDYPISLTPPLEVATEWSMTNRRLAWFRNNRFAVAHRYTAAQNRVARNEKTTPGCHLFDVSLTVGLPVSKHGEVQLVAQVQNVMNTKYYRHLSYYRRLNLPETGRNIMLSVVIPINGNNNL
jgi:iron complex outermembrane receptor protein